ncbi:hypothetical protein N9L68_03520 [bacterium]|nr:hypothetical protein [bacterium]
MAHKCVWRHKHGRIFQIACKYTPHISQASRSSEWGGELAGPYATASAASWSNKFALEMPEDCEPILARTKCQYFCSLHR